MALPRGLGRPRCIPMLLRILKVGVLTVFAFGRRDAEMYGCLIGMERASINMGGGSNARFSSIRFGNVVLRRR